MKNFENEREDLKNENPSLYFTLEIAGRIMAAKDRRVFHKENYQSYQVLHKRQFQELKMGLISPL